MAPLRLSSRRGNGPRESTSSLFSVSSAAGTSFADYRLLFSSSSFLTTATRHSLRISCRHASIAAFAAAVQQIQAQQRAVQTASPVGSGGGGMELGSQQSKLQQIQSQGKQLFDTETIEVPVELRSSTTASPRLPKGGASPASSTTTTAMGSKEEWTPQVASIIAQAAVQWHISPLRGQAYAEVLNWAMTASAEEVMDVRSLARILHSALVLRAPQLYPLLMTYIPLLLKSTSPSSPHYGQLRNEPATLAVLLNAYGRAGVQHELLYEKLCHLGEEVLADPTLTMAHVANVVHALAKVRAIYPGILSTLRNQAVRQKDSATPLMSITLLNAFAELSFKDEELFSVFEEHLLKHVNDLTPPLLASLLHSLVTAERASSCSSSSSVLLQRIGEQITRTAGRFDAFPIAKVMTAYFASGNYSEEALGALAERACAVVSDFRSEEVARVLEALSALDLFDGELFPLLASRIATLVKQAAPITIEDAACALASFAAVQEPNDELHHWCGKVFVEYADASMLSAEAYINVIWGCLALNIRNEAQKKFVDAVKARPQLLQPLETEAMKWHKPKKAILEERRAKIIKSYGIAA